MKQTQMEFGKDSAVETKLRGNWIAVSLGELLPLTYGKGLTKSSRTPGPVPVIGSSGQVGVHDRSLTAGETLVVGRKGNVGSVVLTKGPCWPIDTVYYTEAVPGLEAKFCLHLLRFLNLRSLDRSTAIPGLSRDDYNAVETSIPPLKEQQRIVDSIDSYFSRLDDAIATLERVERNLKRYRASVLKAAVEGRLVPTEAALARAEGREFEPASALLERVLVERRQRWEAQAWEKEIAKARKKAAKTARKADGRPWKRGDAFAPGELEGIDEAGYARYLPKDDRWKAKYVEPAAPDVSGLSALPAGWCWATVEQLLSTGLANGRSVKTDDSGFPVLRLTALKDRVIDLSERKGGAWTYSEAKRFLIKKGDFLVARGNGSLRLVGRGGLVLGKPDAVAYPDTLIRIRLCTGVDIRYFAIAWHSSFLREQVERFAKTTAGIYKVNQADLSKCFIPLPPIAEQTRIRRETESLESTARRNRELTTRSLVRSKRLRQSILKWAFEGKLADQDPNDEPAAALLARIQAERAAAEHTRKRRKKKDPR